MKKILELIALLFVFLVLSPSVHAIEEKSKEIAIVDSLIACAQNNVTQLISLREKIVDYQTQEALYMQNPQNTEALYKMIKNARVILENLQESRLSMLFDAAFLSELTIVSKPATKLGIPKP